MKLYSIVLSILVSQLTFEASAQSTVLNIRISDSSTGEIVPARVEVVDEDGNYFVADDALLVGGDCDMTDEGSGLVDLETTLASFTDRVLNPYTNSTQFYSDGTSALSIAEGVYTVKVFKGIEYNIFQDTISIEREDKSLSVELDRWINMPKEGWFSSDGHLHIPRPVEELNLYISNMMKAEDIHVANLLQMGKQANISIAKQHAHGSDGYYQDGNYILAAGQENPRSHFLGHTITLGAQKVINNTEKYLIYRYVWEESVKQGGINGFAHGNRPEGTYLGVSAHDGLSVILPLNLTHFIEVLQFNNGDYDLWYDVLNLGFKVAPTAGTDYPCVGSNLPGRERFYTKVHDELNYENWIDGVRKGRTFVTNGPFIEFNVNNKDIGGEINFSLADSVRISGKVSVNPDFDFIDIVEIVQNGNVIKRISALDGQGEVKFDFNIYVTNSSWFAVRGYGHKKSELGTLFSRTNPAFFSFDSNRNYCHSAPVYVTIPNAENTEKKRVAGLWLNRLADIENMLSDANIELLYERTESQFWHSVSKETLLNNRKDLMKEISDSRQFFSELLKTK